MIKHFPLVTGFLISCFALMGCKPFNNVNSVEFETLKAAQSNLSHAQLPDWLPMDATYIKLQTDPHKDNVFVRFKTKQTQSWLPMTCYKSNFIDQLPKELPSWWPSNATQYRQINAFYKLYLCKDQSLWWVAIPNHAEFVLMWK